MTGSIRVILSIHDCCSMLAVIDDLHTNGPDIKDTGKVTTHRVVIDVLVGNFSDIDFLPLKELLDVLDYKVFDHGCNIQTQKRK